MGDVYILFCLQSAELIKAFGLRNLYYSNTYVVMLLGDRIAVISRKSRVRTKKCPAPKRCIFK